MLKLPTFGWIKNLSSAKSKIIHSVGINRRRDKVLRSDVVKITRKQKCFFQVIKKKKEGKKKAEKEIWVIDKLRKQSLKSSHKSASREIIVRNCSCNKKSKFLEICSCARWTTREAIKIFLSCRKKSKRVPPTRAQWNCSLLFVFFISGKHRRKSFFSAEIDWKKKKRFWMRISFCAKWKLNRN